MRPCFLALVIVLASSCTKPPEVATHRERARAVLEQRCGMCHLPAATGDAEFDGLAIHIFDLTKPDWSATLRDSQLDVLVTKMKDDAPPPEDVKVIEQFVVDERKWRDAHPESYPALLR